MSTPAQPHDADQRPAPDATTDRDPGEDAPRAIDDGALTAAELEALALPGAHLVVVVGEHGSLERLGPAAAREALRERASSTASQQSTDFRPGEHARGVDADPYETVKTLLSSAEQTPMAEQEDPASSTASGGISIPMTTAAQVRRRDELRAKAKAKREALQARSA